MKVIHILSLFCLSFLAVVLPCTANASCGVAGEDLSEAAMIGDDEPLYDTIHVNVCQNKPYHGEGFDLTDRETFLLGDTLHRTRSFVDDDGKTVYLTMIATVRGNPRIRLGGETSFCQGGFTTLTANGGCRYRWSTGDTTATVIIRMGGTFTATCYNEDGCFDTDSMVITVDKPIKHEQTRHICRGDTIEFRTERLYESCRREAWLKTPEGCDSLTVLYVELHENPVVAILGNAAYCAGSEHTLTATGAQTYFWSDSSTNESLTPMQDGIYHVRGLSQYGCWGSDTIEVRQLPVHSTALSDSICSGASVSFYRRELRATGVYSFTDTNIYGCDSVVTMTLTVSRPTTHDFTVFASDSYNWNDSTYTEWGDYRQMFVNANGCDSMAVLHLGIIHGLPVPRILNVEDRILMVDHFPAGEGTERVDYKSYRWVKNGYVQYDHTSDQYHIADYPRIKGCFWVEVLADSVHWMPSDTICIDYDINDVEVEEVDDMALSLAVYPNPVASGALLTINVDGVDFAGGEVTLVDSYGRHHAKAPMVGTMANLAMPSVTGVYTLVLSSADGRRAARRVLVR